MHCGDGQMGDGVMGDCVIGDGVMGDGRLSFVWTPPGFADQLYSFIQTKREQAAPFPHFLLVDPWH